MTLIEQIEEDFKSALKNKEVVKLSTLRMLKTALHNWQIAEQKELTQDDVIKVIQKEIKQRRDSITTFDSSGRTELANKEKKEIEILEKYMPAQLSDGELRKIIEAAITETGATSPADMGRVMGKVMPQVAGRADGAQVSAKVKELLFK